jgi:hypothetical protein
MPTEFRLRFPLSEVTFLAARYAYADDAGVVAIGEGARRRGWYTRDEFLTVARWKTQPRPSRCERNDGATVETVTRLALSTPDERHRIGALTRLVGVEFPTASVLLHLAHREPYPIIDHRALWSLGVDPPPTYYSFEFWWAYTRECRALAERAGVSMRTLDRALWQYSNEHQPSTGTSAGESVDAPARVPPARARASKSAAMRRLYEDGQTVAEVAKALNVDRSFAHAVHKRWRASQIGQPDPSLTEMRP